MYGALPPVVLRALVTWCLGTGDKFNLIFLALKRPFSIVWNEIKVMFRERTEL